MSSVGPDRQSEALLVDLLVKQVTEGLTSVEQEALDAQEPMVVLAKRRELEQMLAALSFGIVSNADAPPPELRARITQQALAHFSSPSVARTSQSSRAPVSFPMVRRRSGIVGWLTAAACLVLAIIGWLRPGHPPIIAPPVAGVHLKVPPAVVEEPVVPLKPKTVAEQRDAMLARPETIKVILSATKDPAAAGVTADVVWDPHTQTGFLHLAGLKANDPQVRQYQAWVFDGARDKRYPIDVAIFDVPPGTPEVIVPIQAAIPVKLANAFAVTVEKPGGVVVPDRTHVVVLGSAG